jgi:hypothetical protein
VSERSSKGFRPERASTIIEITFPGGSQPGTFGRISHRALSDWHAFALISQGTIAKFHMMVISGVGDFTKGLIAKPPPTLYVRRLKFPGLPYCVSMYQRSIIIATGAGMATCLKADGKTSESSIWYSLATRASETAP